MATYYQAIYDDGADRWCYYSDTSIDSTPASIVTSPNWVGPTISQHTVLWVDPSAGAAALDIVKTYVRIATVVAGTLATDFVAGLSVDGKVLILGDRILVKNQVSVTENGVYIVTAGAPTRATDFDAVGDITNGAIVYVTTGDYNTGTFWALGTTGAVPGVSNLTFVRVNGYTSSTGIAISPTSVITADIQGTPPSPVGTAAAGATGKLADAGHIHALQTPSAPLVNTAGVLSLDYGTFVRPYTNHNVEGATLVAGSFNHVDTGGATGGTWNFVLPAPTVDCEIDIAKAISANTETITVTPDAADYVGGAAAGVAVVLPDSASVGNGTTTFPPAWTLRFVAATSKWHVL